MDSISDDYAAQANCELIAQAARYYNNTREDLVFYQRFNSDALQKLSRKHLMHWKKKLRSLIFNGMNCIDQRRKEVHDG